MKTLLGLLILFLSLLTGCASSGNKKEKPYEVKEYSRGFDFSTMKKNTKLYISHSNGIYYKGVVNLEKSGPGRLCLYLGTGTRCFKQSNIVEITQNKSTGFKGGTLLANLIIISIFVGLLYLLPGASD